MKLHLPSLLRKALLSCLAALAFPMTAVTCGSGAAIMGGVAVVAFAVGQQVMASTENAEDGYTYGGNIYFVDVSELAESKLVTNGMWKGDASYDGRKQWVNRDGAMVEESAASVSWTDALSSGNTLRLKATRDTTLTLKQDFRPLKLGGLIVDGGCAGYTIQLDSTSAGKNFVELDSADTDMVHISVASDMKFKASNHDASAVVVKIVDDTSWHVAAGKTLTWEDCNVMAEGEQDVFIDKLGEEEGVGRVQINGSFTLTSGDLTIGEGVELVISRKVASGNTHVTEGLSVASGTVTVDGTLTLDTDTNTIGTLTGNGTVSLLSGTTTVTTINVAAEKELVLDGARDGSGTWTGAGTLTVESITGAGRLVIKGQSSGDTAFSTVFGTYNTNYTIPSFDNSWSGTLVLALRYTVNSENRPHLSKLIGSYNGKLELADSYYQYDGSCTASYSSLEVKAGAQFYISNSSGYNGTVYIAGMGVDMGSRNNQGAVHVGAIRLNNNTLSGNLYLTGDAAVIVGPYNSTSGTINSAIDGQGHTLYKHGNGSLTIGGSISGLVGIVTRNYRDVDSTYTNAGDGGNITFSSTASLAVANGEEFVFGVRASGTMTFQSGAQVNSLGTIVKEGAGTLKFESGSHLTLGRNLELNEGILELAAGTLTLNDGASLVANARGLLKLGEGFDTTGLKVVVNTSDVTENYSEWEFQLYHADSAVKNQLSDENLQGSTLARRYKLTMDEDGTVRVAVDSNGSAADLTWTDATLTWSRGDVETMWSVSGGGQDYFHSEDNVIFDRSGQQGNLVDVQVSGDIVAGNVTVTEGTEVRLDAHELHDNAISWGGTLKLTADSKIKGAGVLTLGGVVSSDSDFRDVFGLYSDGRTAPQFHETEWTGTVALDYDTVTTAASHRPHLSKILGSYSGKVELRGTIYQLDGDVSAAYSSLTVADGAQLYLNKDNYAGSITISGMGVYTTDNEHAQAVHGALRIDAGKTLSGTLYLAADAAVVTSGGNNTTITLTDVQSVQGGSYTLYKHGNGYLAITGAVSGLSGIVARNYQDIDNRFNNKAGDGGHIYFRSGSSLNVGAVDGEKVFTLSTPSRLGITFESGSTLSGARNITKSGGGELTLSGAISHTGTLTVTEGTLNLNANYSSGTVKYTNTRATLNLAGNVGTLNLAESMSWGSPHINTNVTVKSSIEVGTLNVTGMAGILFDASNTVLTITDLTVSDTNNGSGDNGNLELRTTATTVTGVEVFFRNGGSIHDNLYLNNGIVASIGNGKTLTVRALNSLGDSTTASLRAKSLTGTTTGNETATLAVMNKNKGGTGKNLTFESGITLHLVGLLDSTTYATVQTLEHATIQGEVTLDAGTTLRIVGTGETLSSTLSGTLNGSGKLELGSGNNTAGELIWTGSVGSGNKAFTGELAMGSASNVLTLGSNLSVGKLTGAGTINMQVTTPALAGVTLTLTGSSDSESNFSSSVGSGVKLVVSNGTHTYTGTSLGGAVEISSPGTLVLSNSSAATMGGALSGSGTLELAGTGKVTLTSGGTVGALAMGTAANTATSLELSADLEVGALTAGSGTNSITGTGNYTLTINSNTNGDTGSGSVLELGDTVTLRKIGSGAQTVHGLTANKVLVEGGSLVAGAGGTFSVKELTVDASKAAQGATVSFDINRAGFTSATTNVVLKSGGALRLTLPQTASETNEYKLGSLTLSGAGNTLSMGAQATGSRTLTFSSLTGSGNLDLGTLNGSGNANYQRLYFEQITNLNGTVTGNSGANAANRVRIGHVHQDAGMSGVLNITGATGVYSTDFRKTGEGSFSVNQLTVNGSLWMDYEGTLSITQLAVASGSMLHYTTGTTDHLLEVSGAAFLNADYELVLDVATLSAQRLRDGICLGISGETGLPTLSTLQERFSLYGLDDANTQWRLEWLEVNGKQMLHLYIDEIVLSEGNIWDSNWMTGALNAPERDQMHIVSTQLGTAAPTHGNFDHVLAAGTVHGGMVVLAENSGGAHAVVLGGALYSEEAGSVLDRNSYIYMEGGEYHMLVGGSSCLVFADDSTAAAAGIYRGDSHIQVSAGTVDYLVGGNHVNNSAFTFEGNSYISVYDGAVVRGGIVGGSTLTKGSSRSDVYAFLGDSNIFIYTTLSGSNADAPSIWVDTVVDPDDATTSTGGESFAAVVGGNAWVDIPSVVTDGTAMDPTFHGNSSITIDLTGNEQAGRDAVTSGTFEKDIVGGNYTAVAQGASGRNTTFEGNSNIRIDAANTVVFTGSINGASRRASGGSGKTVFNGAVNIMLNGGTYKEVVAGGFYFEPSATGSHASELLADTNISIRDGQFWRVVGGSVSLEGDAGSANEWTGSSHVRIEGGVFGSVRNGSSQTETALVVGGDAFRNDSGSGHTQDGSTFVDIVGGSFYYAHLVGGDYVNSSTQGGSASTASVIKKGSSIYVGGVDARQETTVLGSLIVGGSYLTDSGSGGSISVEGGTGIVVEGNVRIDATATADGQKCGYHNGIALVGGNVLIDEEGRTNGASGGHTSKVLGGTHVEVRGGSITGAIVGGSYAGASASANTHSVDEVGILLSGGQIIGNVYGGHYSDNTSQPDHFSISKVTITMDGSASVKGDIVGGSRRAASAATMPGDGEENSAQGDILIQLVSGQLEGHVYAAGENVSTSGNVKTKTTSTRVEVSDDFAFVGQNVLVSGGYKTSGATDASYVGQSTLALTDSSYTGAFNNVTFRDFDAVEVSQAAAEVTLTKVVGKSSGFAKTGAGTLVIGDLQGENGGAYTGRISVDDGILAVKKSLDISQGLSFNLGARSDVNDASSAYLQAWGDALLQKSSSSGTVQITITGWDNNDGSVDLRLGTYYLASGLAGSRTDWENLFSSNVDDLGGDDYQVDIQVREADGRVSLVLKVKEIAKLGDWIWGGDENSGGSAVWSNESDTNWNTGAPDSNPSTEDVRFTASGESQDDVTVDGMVTPNSVTVEGGKYTFSSSSEEDEGMNIGGDAASGDEQKRGQLVVGGAGYEAELELQLRNKSIPTVRLEEDGKLVLAHEAAINVEGKGDTATKIQFNGGILAYKAGEDGLIFNEDISNQVDENSSGLVRVQVGDLQADYEQQLAAEPAAMSLDTQSAAKSANPGEALQITWGDATVSSADNKGVKRALSHGVQKYGIGTFVIAWQGTNQQSMNDAIIEAHEGQLEYRMSGGSLTISADDAQSGEEPLAIVVGSDATVRFAVTGQGQMSISRTFRGAGAEAGTVVIGSSETLPTVGDGQFAYILDADNSKFNGTIELAGQGSSKRGDLVSVKKAAALGGADTTLALSGRHVVLADGSEKVVSAGTVMVTERTTNYLGGLEKDDANEAITLSGALLGSGTLANAKGGFRHSLTGDVGAFTGALLAGADSSWKLERTTTAEETIQAQLGGNGTIEVNYTENTVLTGRVGGNSDQGNSTKLVNNGSGDIILASMANSSTGALDFGSGSGGFRLGDASRAGRWAGSTLEGTQGVFTLVNGELSQGFTAEGKGTISLEVHTAVFKDAAGVTRGTDVSVGGMDGSLFDSIYIEQGGHLKQVGGSISTGSTKVHLVFTENNFGSSRSGDHLISGTGRTSLTVDNLDNFTLDFSNDGLVDILKSHHTANAHTWLRVLANGTLNLDESQWRSLEVFDQITSQGNYGKLLAALGFNIASISGGDIELAGTSTDVYLVLDKSDASGQSHKLTDCDDLLNYKATVVDRGEDLELTLTGAAGSSNCMSNLVGLDGSTLHVVNGSKGDRVSLDLHNALPAAEDGTKLPDGTTLDDVALDTIFAGAIVGDAGVDIEKTGAGMLTIGNGSVGSSGLQIEGGVTLKNGGLDLRGKSSLADFTFDYETDSTAKAGLVIGGGQTTISGSITEDDDHTEGNVIQVQNGAELVLLSDNTLESTQLRGDGSGVLTLGNGKDEVTLTVSSGDDSQATLSGVGVTLTDKSTLALDSDASHAVTTLNGSGTLQGDGQADLAVTGKGSVFSGTLYGQGTLTLVEGASMKLDNITTDNTTNGGWNISNRGSLTLNVASLPDDATLGDLTLGAKSITSILVDTDAPLWYSLGIGTLDWEKGAQLAVESTGLKPITGDDKLYLGIQVDALARGRKLEDLDVSLKGIPFLHYAGSLKMDEGGNLYVGLTRVKDNRFDLPDLEKNARAGAELFWAATDVDSVAWKSIFQGDRAAKSDMFKTTVALMNMLENGDVAALSRTLAAGAGASVSVLGSSLSQDIQRQLSAIRNRTTTMGAGQTYDGYDNAPYYHMWMNAEGNYHKVSADGLAPGYTLNSWGGTMGLEVNLNQEATVGFALTAMFGDLKTDAADRATGDMDTTYLTAFARVARGSWMHTFVLSGGVADVTLNRTVNYGLGSYTAKGNTSGYALGALYEVGYSNVMNEAGTLILQPVFNVEFRHAALDGYTETGTDAALRVSNISHNVVTLGLGMRMQSVVGTGAYNRASLFEARALVKADAGDRSGTAKNALLYGGKVAAEVESAELGAVGIELGAGLTVPMSASGAVFMDASLELRSGYTSANGTVGYRINF